MSNATCFIAAVFLSLSPCCFPDSGPTFRFSEYDPNELYPKRPADEKVDWAGGANVTMTCDEDGLLPLRSLVLTFRVFPKPGRTPVFFFNRTACECGAGLVATYVGEDNTVTRRQLPYEARWHGGGKLIMFDQESLQDVFARSFQDGYSDPLEYFEIHVRAQVHNLSRVIGSSGFCVLTYEHPWRDMQGTNVEFSCKPFVLVVGEEERIFARRACLDDPRLALASYAFRNPPRCECPQYRRARYLDELDKAIKPGMARADVLALLGSPDGLVLPGENSVESWSYEISPVSAYYVDFENGAVFKKGVVGDLPDPPLQREPESAIGPT